MAYKAETVQAAWDNHFGAFGAQDVAKIMLDYTEGSVLKACDHRTGKLDICKGMAEIQKFFEGLFATLKDTSDLATPTIEVTEKPKQVYLIWSCGASGIVSATDTFMFDADNKIKRQNIAFTSMEKSPPLRRSCSRRLGFCVIGLVVVVVLFILWIVWVRFLYFGSTECLVDAENVSGPDGHKYELTYGTCARWNWWNWWPHYCSWNRGPAECMQKQKRCACPLGWCSTGASCMPRVADTTHPLNGTVSARIAPVNASQPKFPGPHSEISSALCFSGGGMRSLSSTLGALRALHDLKVMDQVDAISAVSGGAWAGAIYMYANMSLEQLLGSSNVANGSLIKSKLTMWALRKSPPGLGQVAVTPLEPFLKKLMYKATDLKDLWEMFVQTIVLQPVAKMTNDHGLGTRGELLASHETIDRIRRENPLLRDMSFRLPRKDRPKVFVMSGALLYPRDYHQDDVTQVVSLQMSPDYTGSPFHAAHAARPNGLLYRSSRGSKHDAFIRVGGGFVDSFAVGGEAPTTAAFDSASSDKSVGIPMPAKEVFTLAKALGISSCAGAAILCQQLRIANKSCTSPGVAFAPEDQVWPLPPQGKALMYKMGDGGLIDNAGLLPMLQRKAKTIVWLINTDTALDDQVDFCSGTSRIIPNFPEGLVTNQLSDKFGYGTNTRGVGYLGNNQVFAQADFLEVTCKLQMLKRMGRPAVARYQHTVLKNDWWGIEGGFAVDVLYVYSESSSDFESQLPQDTRDELSKSKTGKFDRFPFYKTTGQNGMRQFTQLTNEQVNLLATNAEFALWSAQADIKEMFSAQADRRKCFVTPKAN